MRLSRNLRLPLPHLAPSALRPLPYLLVVIGCANPGPPKPPTLSLPAPVTDLRAERIGNNVQLTWTTSSETTDDLPVRPPLTAEICRDSAASPRSALRCTSIRTLPVSPGVSSVSDPLPAPLLNDPVEPLLYRVRLLNAKGRFADASNAALAASGTAPSPVTGLLSAPTAGGLRLQWQEVSSPDSAVLLERSLVDPPHPKQTGTSPGKRAKSPNATSPSIVRLVASPQGRDSGGAIDLTSQRDARYTYTAQRERSVTVGGRALILRSASSEPLTVQVRDLTPPSPPTGLAGVAFGSAVDLSWEPNTEPDLAGYLVERATLPDGEAVSPGNLVWQRLSETPVTAPGFRDFLSAGPGRFRYRVLSVDKAGNRSAPGAPVTVQVHAEPRN